MHSLPLATRAAPSFSLSKTNHSKRFLLCQICRHHGQGFLSLSTPQHVPPSHGKTTPNRGCFCSGCLVGTLSQPGVWDRAHLGPYGITSKWDLLFQTCSTGAFPDLRKLMTLSSNEAQGWQSQRSGSQGSAGRGTLCLDV